MQKPILIVDDDPAVHQALEAAIHELGYPLAQATDGRDGLAVALKGEFSLIVLDLTLPFLGGLELCRRLREEKPQVPVLMLTSRSEEIDKLLGFEAGADDYLVKPFSSREVVARIRAIIRRSGIAERAGVISPTDGEPTIVHGALKIDLLQRRVTRAGKQVNVSALEFDLLVYLALNSERVITRQELMEQVWGYSASSFDNTVTTQMSRLRSKIEADPENPRLILTLRGVGYRFNSGQESTE